MVQTFPFPEEILVAISDRVLIVCTSVWRRVCIQEGLAAYRERTANKPTQRWLDTWKTELSRLTPANLPALDDSRDDWERLRTNAYGSDVVLKLCDVGNKGRFASHIICASIYEREIRVLIGQEDCHDDVPLRRLKRHL